MKFRMNGRSFRSASDIAGIIASIPTEPLTAEEVERRVELYASRESQGLDIFTGEPRQEIEDEHDESIPDGAECGE